MDGGGVTVLIGVVVDFVEIVNVRGSVMTLLTVGTG